VRVPSERGDRRQVVAKREDGDPRHRDTRGRATSTPSDMPTTGWKDILRYVHGNIPKHRLIAIAPGVPFYVLLAIFPGIAALVVWPHCRPLNHQPASQLSFGRAARRGHRGHRRSAPQVDLAAPGKLGSALLFGLAVSLRSANAGMKAFFDALNVVYGQRRGAVFSS